MNVGKLPTEEEFNAWKHDMVTEFVCRVLEAKRDTMRRQWEGGAFTDYDNSTMGLVNVGNIGTCRGYAYVQELSYIDLLTEAEDGPDGTGTGSDKQQRTET